MVRLHKIRTAKRKNDVDKPPIKCLIAMENCYFRSPEGVQDTQIEIKKIIITTRKTDGLLCL